MLVFAGLSPHSPLLLPSINPDRVDEAAKTHAGLQELRDNLYAARPDTLVLFSEHLTMYPDHFSVSVADPYQAHLTDFGDLGYHKTYHPDFSLIDRLQRFMRKSQVPLTLSTDDELHYSSVVPLELLTIDLPNIRIVPLAPSSLSGKDHVLFGNSIKHALLDSDKRIALLACGDTSHAGDEAHPAIKDFEEALVACLENRDVEHLASLDPALLENSQQTCYRQVCMLLGVLDGIGHETKILSHEAPHGVGYVVAECVLH